MAKLALCVVVALLGCAAVMAQTKQQVSKCSWSGATSECGPSDSLLLMFATKADSRVERFMLRLQLGNAYCSIRPHEQSCRSTRAAACEWEGGSCRTRSTWACPGSFSDKEFLCRADTQELCKTKGTSCAWDGDSCIVAGSDKWSPERMNQEYMVSANCTEMWAYNNLKICGNSTTKATCRSNPSCDFVTDGADVCLPRDWAGSSLYQVSRDEIRKCTDYKTSETCTKETFEVNFDEVDQRAKSPIEMKTTSSAATIAPLAGLLLAAAAALVL